MGHIRPDRKRSEGRTAWLVTGYGYGLWDMDAAFTHSGSQIVAFASVCFCQKSEDRDLGSSLLRQAQLPVLEDLLEDVLKIRRRAEGSPETRFPPFPPPLPFSPFPISPDGV